jgi:hypothetical protein
MFTGFFKKRIILYGKHFISYFLNEGIFLQLAKLLKIIFINKRSSVDQLIILNFK